MTENKPTPLPPSEQSQAFFAALLAAMSGDDKKAGDILRQIGNKLLEAFTPKLGEGYGRRKRKD